MNVSRHVTNAQVVREIAVPRRPLNLVVKG
jgi:hypothetical protein